MYLICVFNTPTVERLGREVLQTVMRPFRLNLEMEYTQKYNESGNDQNMRDCA